MSDDGDLWDPMDHEGMRKKIEEGTIEEWGRAFPAEYGGIRLEANNIRFTGKPNFSLQDQKKAWMENRELGRSLKADLELYDRETGELLDRKPDLTLMKVPHYTDRGTFVYNGNNYTCASQARLIPGVYTRRQTNGGLESQFNTRSGTGRVFRVGLDPESGQFRLKIGGSNLHLYSVLKDSGVSDEELERQWGPDILRTNKDKYDVRALNKAYQKFVPRYIQKNTVDDADKASQLMDALNKAQVATKTVSRTLAAYWKPRDPDKVASGEVRSMLRLFFPKKAAATDKPFSAGFDIRSKLGTTDDEGDEYQSVGLEGLLASTSKLLAVNRGLDTPDERSIPTFTKVYTMDKLMRERIRLDEGKLRRNILRMVASRKNLSPIHPRVFDPYYKEIITKNPMTTPIEETNPLQLVGQQRRITHMGPGGIGSLDAVTPDMNAVQANELGFYSPIEGPECFDAQSEVYTARGWVAWPDVNSSDRIACRVEGALEFRAPVNLICQAYEGPLFEVSSKHFRMAVTPTHRVLHEPPDGQELVLAAEQGFGAVLRIPITHLPSRGPSNSEQRGWLEKALKGYRLGCASSNPKLIARVEEAAIALGIPVLVSSTKVGDETRYSVLRARRRHVKINASDWKRSWYVGNVYCATVPGGLMFVRGRVGTLGYWSGNSGAAGVDVRLAWGAKIGKDGRMRRPMLNRRTGLTELVSPGDIYDKFVKFPD
jgi:hypothetical protein